jgi:histidine triad (HIT) family protein
MTRETTENLAFFLKSSYFIYMPSSFEKILSHQDTQWIVAENEFFIAVLETKPLVLGHVVIISKNEVDDFYDLPVESLASCLIFSQKLAKAIQKCFLCLKVGTAVIGLETRHAHLHLVPMQTADDLNFTRAKISPSNDELSKAKDQLKAVL